MNLYKSLKIWLVPLLICVNLCPGSTKVQRPGWETKKVNWKIAGKSRIKSISYPKNNQPRTLQQHRLAPRVIPRKKIIPPEIAKKFAPLSKQSAAVFANVIDSPPIDGFIPWVVISITDANAGDLYEINTFPAVGVSGNYPTGVDPASDYVIGIYDTGASAHIINYDGAVLSGVYANNFVTTSTVEITGVTGSVDARVSFPLGLFIDSLGAIDSNGHLSDGSYMIGEINISIAVGQAYSPDLANVAGCPLAVYFAVDIQNNKWVTLNRDFETYVAPEMHFYDLDDPDIPVYSNSIMLQLRPTGSVAVQYFPCIEIFSGNCPDGDGAPLYPSLLTGFLPTQSLFFIPGVDLYKGTKSALDKQGFMVDTGAQVSVVGSIIASRLALNPNAPDFEVEILGVDGSSIMAPGFYLDALDIPALGEWLSFTNVPVILLDITSPEGGYLEGIIGMNLFVDLNFVFNGGGLPSQYPAYIDFDFLPPRIPGDVAPGNGDWAVDYIDLAAFSAAWLATDTSLNWNPKCNLAPVGNPDQIINFLDFAVMASHWMEQTAP